MLFQWDESKADANRRKHRIEFMEALTAFDDPFATIFLDEEHSIDEQRQIIIGYSAEGRLLVVVYTEREPHIIRIISARFATPKERRKYEENPTF